MDADRGRAGLERHLRQKQTMTVRSEGFGSPPSLDATPARSQTPASAELKDEVSELLARELVGGGTSVINCVVHMGVEMDRRPVDCRLCNADIRNLLGRALVANAWLNHWRDDALRTLAALEAGAVTTPERDSAEAT